MTLSSLPLSVSGMELGLYMGLAGLAAAIIFAGLGMFFHHRRQALWHETARVALEKGQPLPPLQDQEKSPSWETTPSRGDNKNDFRSGLVLVAVGAGLYLFLSAFLGRAFGLVGAIPGFVGVALLLYGLLNVFFGSKDKPAADRQSQP
jgi:small-conductance mechanosensitive channel